MIALLGGSWGRIPLEKQFDEAEQALYHCQQKNDESNDSYLARSEILWSRLLARKISLEELQAFIVLRGSSLAPEDKKRVILESDRDGAGKLTNQKVSEAIRMLGATFFMDMTGQRRGKTKVYDQSVLTVEDVPDSAEGLMAAEGMTEEDFVDTLITEGEDEDAAMIADFEAAASELIKRTWRWLRRIPPTWKPDEGCQRSTAIVVSGQPARGPIRSPRASFLVVVASLLGRDPSLARAAKLCKNGFFKAIAERVDAGVTGKLNAPTKGEPHLSLV